MIKEKSIGGIIFFEENKQRFYLLLEYERVNDKLGIHKYLDFPKGHAEKYETEIETLKREVKEETNLDDIEVIRGFKKNIKFFFKKDGNLINKEVVFYLIKSNSKEVKLSFEHSGFTWLSYDEALKKINFKNSKDILKEAEKFLNNSLLNY